MPWKRPGRPSFFRMLFTMDQLELARGDLKFILIALSRCLRQHRDISVEGELTHGTAGRSCPPYASHAWPACGISPAQWDTAPEKRRWRPWSRLWHFVGHCHGQEDGHEDWDRQGERGEDWDRHETAVWTGTDRKGRGLRQEYWFICLYSTLISNPLHLKPHDLCHSTQKVLLISCKKPRLSVNLSLIQSITLRYADPITLFHCLSHLSCPTDSSPKILLVSSWHVP